MNEIHYAADFGADFTLGINGPDQAPAINAALDHAAATATAGHLGAVVQLPHGVASVRSTLNVREGTVLRGHGPYLTEMYAQGFNEGPIIKVSNSKAARVEMLSLAAGGGSGGPLSHGIEVVASPQRVYSLGGDMTTISDVIIAGAYGYGVVFQSGVIEARAINCYVRTGPDGLAGFVLWGTDNYLLACAADGCGREGFGIYSPNNKIVGCKAFGSGASGVSGSGYNISGQRNMLSGCESQDNRLYGFNDPGGDNTFAACVADTNGRGGGTMYGFFLTGASAAAACFAINRQGGTQSYGYRTSASALGATPSVAGCTSRLPGIAHVHPSSVGSVSVN